MIGIQDAPSGLSTWPMPVPLQVPKPPFGPQVKSSGSMVARRRPSDIATYVERGAADLGIVGKDVLLESEARVMELADLGFGACRLVVAAPRGAVERSLDEYRHLGTLEVATKYPNVAEQHFRARDIAVEIVKVAGSAEVAPLVGLADWIVDLVATGSTLRANGPAGKGICRAPDFDRFGRQRAPEAIELVGAHVQSVGAFGLLVGVLVGDALDQPSQHLSIGRMRLRFHDARRLTLDCSTG